MVLSTPTRPELKEIQTYNLDQIRECNWLVIGKNMSKKVIGGYWEGQVPAHKNINLINAFASSDTKYI